MITHHLKHFPTGISSSSSPLPGASPLWSPPPPTSGPSALLPPAYSSSHGYENRSLSQTCQRIDNSPSSSSYSSPNRPASGTGSRNHHHRNEQHYQYPGYPLQHQPLNSSPPSGPSSSVFGHPTPTNNASNPITANNHDGNSGDGGVCYVPRFTAISTTTNSNTNNDANTSNHASGTVNDPPPLQSRTTTTTGINNTNKATAAIGASIAATSTSGRSSCGTSLCGAGHEQYYTDGHRRNTTTTTTTTTTYYDCHFPPTNRNTATTTDPHFHRQRMTINRHSHHGIPSHPTPTYTQGHTRTGASGGGGTGGTTREMRSHTRTRERQGSPPIPGRPHSASRAPFPVEGLTPPTPSGQDTRALSLPLSPPPQRQPPPASSVVLFPLLLQALPMPPLRMLPPPPPTAPARPPPTYRNLFVSRLPPAMDDAGLLALFADLGAVQATVIREATTASDAQAHPSRGGRSKGFGFVLFANDATGRAAHNTFLGSKARGELVAGHDISGIDAYPSRHGPLSSSSTSQFAASGARSNIVQRNESESEARD